MEKLLKESGKDVESLRVVLIDRDDIVVETRFGKHGFCKELLLQVVSALLLGGAMIAAMIISTNLFISHEEHKFH